MAELDLDAATQAGNDARYAANMADALVAEVRRLRPIAEWAADAPHLDGCLARHNAGVAESDPPRKPYPCTCGRDELFGEELDRG